MSEARTGWFQRLVGGEGGRDASSTTSQGEADLTQTKERAAQREADLAEMRALVERTGADLAEANERVQLRDYKIEQLEQKLHALQADFGAQLAGQQSVFEARYAEATARVNAERERWQTELELSGAKGKQLTEQVRARDAALASLRAERDELRRQGIRLGERLAQKEQEARQLSAATSEFEAVMNRRVVEAEGAQAAAAEAQTVLIQQQRLLAAAEARALQAEAQAAELEKRLERSTQIADTRETQCSRLEHELSQARVAEAQGAVDKRALRELSKEVGPLRERVQRAEADARASEARAGALRRQVDAVTAVVDEFWLALQRCAGGAAPIALYLGVGASPTERCQSVREAGEALVGALAERSAAWNVSVSVHDATDGLRLMLAPHGVSLGHGIHAWLGAYATRFLEGALDADLTAEKLDVLDGAVCMLLRRSSWGAADASRTGLDDAAGGPPSAAPE